MRAILVAVAALPLLLAACGKGDDADRQPSPAAEASMAGDAPPAIPAMGPERDVLAFGDSLLAGYGLNDGESYPARLEKALRARGINARIANAGVSGDTTAAALQRLDFTLASQAHKPELAIVSLGGNDMLRGLSPDDARRNLSAIIETLQKDDVRVLLLGMMAAPNMGKDYAARFNPIYPQLAQKYHVALVPFFLQAVIDKPDLLQADHMHPTALGVDAIVAATADDVADALPKVKTQAPSAPAS